MIVDDKIIRLMVVSLLAGVLVGYAYGNFSASDGFGGRSVVADRNALKEYESTIDRGYDEFLSSVGDRVPSTDIWQAAFFLSRADGPEIYPGPDDEGEIYYRQYTRNYTVELDCNSYEGADYLVCQNVRLRAGADPAPVLSEVFLRDYDTYTELFFLGRIVDAADDLSFEGSISRACAKFAENYRPVAPEDLCDRYVWATGVAYCFGNPSKLQELAYAEPETPREFVCYGRSHRNLKHWLDDNTYYHFVDWEEL